MLSPTIFYRGDKGELVGAYVTTLRCLGKFCDFEICLDDII